MSKRKKISRALLMINNTTIKPVLGGEWHAKYRFQRMGGDQEFYLST